MSFSFKVRKSAILQYLCLFLALFTNQSSLFHNIFNNTVILFAIAFIGLIILKKGIDKYVIVFLGGMLLICALGRLYTNGGVGISTWLMWAAMISCTYYAIVIDEKMALTRFVNIVYCLSIISLICFVIGLIAPGILRNIGYTYNNVTAWRTWESATEYTAHHYQSHDLILYVLNDNHARRNCGMFTEPGIYQMVLNTVLFILLFMKEYIAIDSKRYVKALVVIISTLITTQSTTGYFGLGIILLIYAINNKHNNKNISHKIELIILIGVVILIADVGIRGASSFIGSTIIGKVFTKSGDFSLAANTGEARIGAIFLCLTSMLTHPFGIGYEKVHEMLNVDVTGYLAAQILQTGAALGVIAFMIILIWIFYPVIKSDLCPCSKVAFVVLYFNTALAQSREFYPALIIVPLGLLVLENYTPKNNEIKVVSYEK